VRTSGKKACQLGLVGKSAASADGRGREDKSGASKHVKTVQEERRGKLLNANGERYATEKSNVFIIILWKRAVTFDEVGERTETK